MSGKKSRILPVWMFVVALAALCAGRAVAAVPENAQQDTYRYTFGQNDFRVNQDGKKYQVPENGAYKVVPRIAEIPVWTYFQIPEAEQMRKVWIATATVRSSDGPAGGVGIGDAKSEYAFCVYPDGSGSLSHYAGRRRTWAQNVHIQNFSYPALLTLWRDENGNVIAMVNGTVVATRLFEIDMKKPKAEKVTHAFFATHAPTRAGTAIYYESLHLEGKGTRAALESTEGAQN